jgi:hypothetical protein
MLKKTFTWYAFLWCLFGYSIECVTQEQQQLMSIVYFVLLFSDVCILGFREGKTVIYISLAAVRLDQIPVIIPVGICFCNILIGRSTQSTQSLVGAHD